MDCPTCEAMVDAYVDGELSARDSAEFEAALAACPDCRHRLETARSLSGLLRAGMITERDALSISLHPAEIQV